MKNEEVGVEKKKDPGVKPKAGRPKLEAQFEAATRALVEGWLKNPEVGALESEYRLVVDKLKELHSDLSTVDAWYVVDRTLSQARWFRITGRGQQQADSLVNEITAFVATLPRTYHLHVEFPGMMSRVAFQADITPNLKLITRPPEDDSKFGAVHTMWVGISAFGYFDVRSTSGAVALSLLSTLKQVLYLMQYFKLSRYFWPQQHEPAVRVYDASDGQALEDFKLPQSLAEYIQALAFVGPTGQAEMALPAHSDIPKYAAKAIQGMTRFFQGQGSDDHTRMAAAIEWMVDTMTVQDQTLAYLSACIGLEALLQDADSEIQTARLADRYAFTFGRGRSHRRELYGDFMKAFATRGNLVHARKPRLMGADFEQLQAVRGIFARCLEHELRLHVDPAELN